MLYASFYFPPDFAHLHRVRSRWQEVKSIDYVGVILFTGGLLLFLMGLSWGGGQYAWKSGHVIGTLVSGFVALVAFVFYGKCSRLWYQQISTDRFQTEIYSGIYRPLVPMHIFRDFQFDAIVILTTVGGMIYYSMTGMDHEFR